MKPIVRVIVAILMGIFWAICVSVSYLISRGDLFATGIAAVVISIFIFCILKELNKRPDPLAPVFLNMNQDENEEE